MEQLEEEITALETELLKLKARKKAAEMSADSGQFIHSNIVFTMAKFHEANPPTQKALFKALIKEIIIHDHHIDLRMYIGQPLQGPSPDDHLDKTNPTPASKNGTGLSHSIPHENGVSKTSSPVPGLPEVAF